MSYNFAYVNHLKQATNTEDPELDLLSKQKQLEETTQLRDTLMNSLEKGLSTEIIEIQRKNELLSEEVEHLELKHNHRNEEIDYLQKSLKKMGSKWTGPVERTNKELNEQVVVLQQKLTVKNNELIATRRELQKKEEELETKITEIEEKSVLVKQLQQEVETLKQQLCEKQEDLNTRQIESSLLTERCAEEAMVRMV